MDSNKRNRSILKIAWYILYKSRLLKIILLACTAAAVANSMLSILATKNFGELYYIIKGENKERTGKTLFKIFATIFALYTAQNISSLLREILSKHFSLICTADTLLETLYIDYNEFHRTEIGEYLSILNRARYYWDSSAEIWLSRAPDSLITIIMILYVIMKPLEFKMAFSFFIFVTCFIVFSTTLTSFVFKRDIISTAAYYNTTGVLSGILSNFDIVRAYSKENYEEKTYAISNASFYAAHSAEINLKFFVEIFPKMMFFSPLVLVLYLYITGSDYVAFERTAVIEFTLLYVKLEIAVHLFRKYIYRAMRSGLYLKRRLDLPECPAVAPEIKSIKFDESINLDNASLFAGNDLIQKNVSLEFNKGDKIAITGVNGCGKSTLLKTFIKFFRHTGSITIDGVSLEDLDEHSLRSLVSYVPQIPFMINNTVIYNLGYSQKVFDEKEIYRQCKVYGCHEYFSSLRDGYLTAVGENGVNLSGGQKQRINFMRAIIKDSPIIILDEPTASMDKNAEIEMVDKLFNAAQDKTVFIILHNLTMLDKFKKILFFDKNKVSLYNSYDEYLNDRK